jgi:transcriptional regulator of acetoin/glycerol metabolism
MTVATPDGAPRLPTLRDAERAHIVRVLDSVSWNKKEAARVLEISRGTLYRKIAEYSLEHGSASKNDTVS